MKIKVMKLPILLLICAATFAVPAFAKPHHKENAAYTEAVKQSLSRAIAMYPEYETEGTALHQAVEDEIHRQKEINPGYFKNTDWPERVARACAAVLGIEPARPMQASK